MRQSLMAQAVLLATYRLTLLSLVFLVWLRLPASFTKALCACESVTAAACVERCLAHVRMCPRRLNASALATHGAQAPKWLPAWCELPHVHEALPGLACHHSADWGHRHTLLNPAWPLWSSQGNMTMGCSRIGSERCQVSSTLSTRSQNSPETIMCKPACMSTLGRCLTGSFRWS